MVMALTLESPSAPSNVVQPSEVTREERPMKQKIAKHRSLSQAARSRAAMLFVPFLLFVASGFCSLLYQIVWLRLAFAAFGVNTPVLSIVLSIFMLGLALGSWL